MDRFDRVVTITVGTIIVTIVYFSVPEYLEARDRSRQKRTMATMHETALLLETGQPTGTLRDAWGTPMRFRMRENHYSLRSAGSDRTFETTEPRGSVTDLASDLVIANGTFLQFPDGM